MKVNCQRTCLMSFSSENREKTLRFVLTFHGQATDKLPTGYRHITDSRLTVGRLSADRFFGELFFTITRFIVEAISETCKKVFPVKSIAPESNTFPAVALLTSGWETHSFEWEFLPSVVTLSALPFPGPRHCI